MSDLTSNNKVLLRRIYAEMWNGAKLAWAAELFARPESVERFVSQFLTAFPDLQHTVEGMIAEGDQVAVRFSAHGTHTGQWLEFMPTGRPIHYIGVAFVRIEDDKIAEHKTWWDRAALIQQLKGDEDFRPQ